MSRPKQFRAPRGAGHVYPAGGLWYIRYSGKGPDGQRKQWSSEPFATREDAELAQAATRRPVSVDWTVKTWSQHLDEFVPTRLHRLRAMGRGPYADILERYYRHLDPLLRSIGRMSSTTTQDAEMVLAALLRNGLSVGYVRRIKSEAGTCWRGAQAAGLPIVPNPFTEAAIDERLAKRSRSKRPGRVGDGDTQALTPDEWELLRDTMISLLRDGPTRALQTARWALPVIIAGDTGCRRGEALGLRLPNVHLEKAYLVIEEQVKKEDKKGPWVLGDPKTRASWRTITIGTELAELIAEHIASHSLTGNDLLFPDPDGNLSKPDSLTRWLKGAARRLGIQTPCTPHVLRATHITLLLSNDVNDVLVSARAGHGSTVFTRSAYEKHITRPDDGLGAAYEDIMRKNRKP